MDDGTDFKNIVAASDRLKARWHATVDHMKAQARELFNVELTPADVVMIPSARVAVLTDDPLSESWINEAKRIPAVAKAARDKELRAALEKGEDEAHADLRRLPPAERIARARELGIEVKGGTAAAPADHAALLRRLMTLSPQQRIAKGREWGLIK